MSYAQHHLDVETIVWKLSNTKNKHLEYFDQKLFLKINHSILSLNQKWNKHVAFLSFVFADPVYNWDLCLYKFHVWINAN